MHPELIWVELFIAQSASDLGTGCRFAVLVLHYLELFYRVCVCVRGGGGVAGGERSVGIVLGVRKIRLACLVSWRYCGDRDQEGIESNWTAMCQVDWCQLDCVKFM